MTRVLCHYHMRSAGIESPMAVSKDERVQLLLTGFALSHAIEEAQRAR